MSPRDQTMVRILPHPVPTERPPVGATAQPEGDHIRTPSVSCVVLYAELLAQTPDLGEHGRQLLRREPELRAALQELAQRLGPQHSPVAVAGVVELADREGGEIRDALARAHQGRAGFRLAVGADVGELERAHEGVDRVLVVARLEAADAEPRVAPPQALVDLLTAFRRKRLVRDRLEQLLGAAERGERLRLARLLHRADRLRRELTDLTPERPRQELLERSHARRWDLRVVEGLAEQAPGLTELLALEELGHRLLVCRPELRTGDRACLGEPLVRGHGAEAALGPRERAAELRSTVVRA